MQACSGFSAGMQRNQAPENFRVPGHSRERVCAQPGPLLQGEQQRRHPARPLADQPVHALIITEISRLHSMGKRDRLAKSERQPFAGNSIDRSRSIAE